MSALKIDVGKTDRKVARETTKKVNIRGSYSCCFSFSGALGYKVCSRFLLEGLCPLDPPLWVFLPQVPKLKVRSYLTSEVLGTQLLPHLCVRHAEICESLFSVRTNWTFKEGLSSNTQELRLRISIACYFFAIIFCKSTRGDAAELVGRRNIGRGTEGRGSSLASRG